MNKSSNSLEQIKSSGVEKGVEAGSLLAETDNSVQLEARDFKVEMRSGLTSGRMLIWDFAEEDGDFVMIKVNGDIIEPNLGILHQSVSFKIPIPSGRNYRDARWRGSITYGIKFPGAIENNAYFNTAAVDSSNVYTIAGQ